MKEPGNQSPDNLPTPVSNDWQEAETVPGSPDPIVLTHRSAMLGGFSLSYQADLRRLLALDASDNGDNTEFYIRLAIADPPTASLASDIAADRAENARGGIMTPTVSPAMGEGPAQSGTASEPASEMAKR